MAVNKQAGFIPRNPPLALGAEWRGACLAYSRGADKADTGGHDAAAVTRVIRLGNRPGRLFLEDAAQ